MCVLFAGGFSIQHDEPIRPERRPTGHAEAALGDRHDDRQRRHRFFWVAGAVILGFFVLLTRGKVTIIEEQTVRPCITGRKTGPRGYLG
jgi:hypothetical protein